MYRNLQITIHEAPPSGRRRTATRASGRGGYDPGQPEGAMIDPTNPGHPEGAMIDPTNPGDPEGAMIDPTNPGHPEGAMTDPTNPQGYPYYGSGYGGAPFVTAIETAGRPVAAVCCCGDGAKMTLPDRPGVGAGDYSGFVIVRTIAGLERAGGTDPGGDTADSARSLYELAEILGLDALREVLDLEFGGAPGSSGTSAAPQGGSGAPQGFAGGVPGAEPEPKRDAPAPSSAGAKKAAAAAKAARWAKDAKKPKGRGEGGEAPGGGDYPSESLGPPRDGKLVSRPLIDLRPRRPESDGSAPALSRPEAVAAICELERAAAQSPFRPYHSLNAYWRVDARRYPDLIEEIVTRFNALAEVDLAYRELSAVDPQLSEGFGATLADDQGYLDTAPVGIGARWTRRHCQPANPNDMGSDGLVVCDLEQGWHLDHEDLPQPPLTLLYGGNRALDEIGEGNHGTAVLGQLAGTGSSEFKIEGAADQVAGFVLASHYLRWNLASTDERYPFRGTNGHVAAAIVNALYGKRPPTPNDLTPPTDQGEKVPLIAGDVLLIEVQRGLRPCEIDAADFDAIRLASALGVIVVEAAGNGGFNLDAYVDPDTGYSLNRSAGGYRDSGAIVVGAARAAVPHDRASFSNYGSRVDCFAWGEAVTSCGYGNLAGTQFDTYTDYYTNTFAGTSSASPIIAGAAALVQALHIAAAAPRLRPQAMRSALSNPASGTRQGPNVAGYIGIMPDLQRIVRDRLQIAPDVYLRRHVEDDGGQPYTDDDISSSPDVILSPKAAEIFAEGRRTNFPAPGLSFDPWNPSAIYTDTANQLHVRLRNRGTDADKDTIELRLFTAPAATLITPERWAQVGDPYTVPDPVLQGDLLTVGGPIGGLDQAAARQLLCFKTPTYTMNASPWPAGITPPFSFLAVQRPAEPGGCGCGAPQAILPPGPPYFDWAAHRKFLRGPGVAWRNAYAVRIQPEKLADVPRWYLPLAFSIAGTPDAARAFDFEIVQRLPKGTEVNLLVPMALAAKIRQRQPWFANGPDKLRLPTRHRTTVEGVQLPAGLYAPATLQVEMDSPGALQPGHSLAIRQIWRGEEVGRITWWFVGE